MRKIVPCLPCWMLCVVLSLGLLTGSVYASEGVTVVTTETFDSEILEEEGLVFAFLWAVWNKPSQMMAPIVEELAYKYDGKLKAVKINTDGNPDIAKRYRIEGLPTFIFFKNGEKLDQTVGSLSMSQLEGKIDSFLEEN